MQTGLASKSLLSPELLLQEPTHIGREGFLVSNLYTRKLGSERQKLTHATDPAKIAAFSSQSSSALGYTEPSVFHLVTSLKDLLFFIFKVCVYVWYVSAGNCSGQKRASDPLGWKLQLVVSHLIWVLETKLRSSSRAVFTQILTAFMRRRYCGLYLHIRALGLECQGDFFKATQLVKGWILSPHFC